MNATVIRFQVRKIEGRKKLAHTIGEVLGFEPEYDGTPTFAYHIGDCVLGRDWTLTTDPLSDGQVEAIVKAALEAGFYTKQPEPVEPSQPAPQAPPGEALGLTLAFPTTGWDEATEAKLAALLAAKAPLITKALGIAGVPMVVNEAEGRVEFPWFTTIPDTATTDAASVLIAAMIAYAKTATRVISKPVEALNEKYAMRCWLLRLGLIGPDTKQVRRELLRHLEGNAAWKNPPHNTEK